MMILTIMRDNTYGEERIVVGSRDIRFRRYCGGMVTLGKDCWLENLEEIAHWVNKELEEDCVFETIAYAK